MKEKMVNSSSGIFLTAHDAFTIAHETFVKGKFKLAARELVTLTPVKHLRPL